MATTTTKPAPKPPTDAEVRRVVLAWARANHPRFDDVDVTVWDAGGGAHDTLPVIKPRYTKAQREQERRRDERRRERNRIAEECSDRLKALFAAAGAWGMTRADRIAMLRGGILPTDPQRSTTFPAARLIEAV